MNEDLQQMEDKLFREAELFRLGRSKLPEKTSLPKPSSLSSQKPEPIIIKGPREK